MLETWDQEDFRSNVGLKFKQKNEVAKFSHRQNYTEIFDGREFLPGPELPWGAYMSCATEVEPGVVFVSGRLVEY